MRLVHAPCDRPGRTRASHICAGSQHEGEERHDGGQIDRPCRVLHRLTGAMQSVLSRTATLRPCGRGAGTVRSPRNLGRQTALELASVARQSRTPRPSSSTAGSSDRCAFKPSPRLGQAQRCLQPLAKVKARQRFGLWIGAGFSLPALRRATRPGWPGNADQALAMRGSAH